MEYLDLDDVLEFLDKRDQVRILASGEEMVTFDQLAEVIVPEISECDRDVLASIAIDSFARGLLEGTSGSVLVIETFLRGIEVGREIQRRTG